MKAQSEKREASRQRIVESAGQAFRRHGLGGIGVDGLAKGAELTSGAFYFHFKSKVEVFVESVKEGLNDLRRGIERFQAEDERGWLGSFVRFYMGFKRTCDLSQGCTLPSLSSEVERAGKDAREAYGAEMIAIANTLAAGLPGGRTMSRRDRAWVILALLSGGVNMARAVNDPELSEEIAAAVQKAALAIGK